ncbi:unnamed protein product [Lactuca virosa]|uniref:DUF4283 domain-containing protein n=1 Tax=Lactuca virosa TaxID=75947 RepID=A0AAU9NI40_9ASTR|nr:unnamed protein product [Lactuca virosa]
MQYERTVWLKILELPLRLWDEANFSSIAGILKKVIYPFNNILNRRGFLIGKVGILTSQRKLINIEVTSMADGMKFNIGVVEYRNDWSPFHPIPFDTVKDDSDEDKDVMVEDEEDDGILDTFMMEDKNEVKEGKSLWNHHRGTSQFQLIYILPSGNCCRRDSG